MKFKYPTYERNKKIMELLKTKPVREIANEYGLTPQRIYDIKNRWEKRMRGDVN